ncbi:MAG: SpoIIE family protein phosphatase [Endomicrobium sp.]|nr:SpoIIE family protein phosphatase [Endomicrobium sp.]
MISKRLYFDDYVSSVPKKNQSVCGDIFGILRKPAYTLAILCDGIGSGIKANIAANMCCERVKNLSLSGLSLRKIFERISSETEKSKISDGFYCALSAVMLFPDGRAIAAAYEMPMPFMLTDGGKWVELKHERVGIFYEANFKLRENDALCFVSDGITQAGMGAAGAVGPEGVLSILNSSLHKIIMADMPKTLTLKACEVSGSFDDDTTAAVLCARQANMFCVFSGAPLLKTYDETAVKKLLSFDGKKAVCGSTTMDIFCRITGRKPKIDAAFFTDFIPPEYEIEGLDFASEGAITLNQCFNIMNDKEVLQKEQTPPAKLANLLNAADIIHFIEGMSVNKGHGDIMFKQMGILPRAEIIYKISNELIKSDKIVSKEKI